MGARIEKEGIQKGDEECELVRCVMTAFQIILNKTLYTELLLFTSYNDFVHANKNHQNSFYKLNF